MNAQRKPITYSSKANKQRILFSSPSHASSDTLIGSDDNDQPPTKRKRVDSDAAVPSLYDALLPSKKRKTAKENTLPSKAKKSAKKPAQLTQLHLSLTSSIKTCKSCGLSYTTGAVDDEHLHRTHCSRVTRGLEWGKEEDKAEGVTVLEPSVRLASGTRGRIVCFKADVKGKLKTKLSALLDTVNVALSAPPIPASTLAESKVYLFLLPTATQSGREKIAGCVLASRIQSAMAISPNVPSSSSSDTQEHSNLVWLDDNEGGIYCDPTPLPTAMGIPRLFVPAEYRKRGIASHLLDAAARTFIYGCPLDPSKGEVAFSQPTGAGRGVMLSWGKGGVRIFQE